MLPDGEYRALVVSECLEHLFVLETVDFDFVVIATDHGVSAWQEGAALEVISRYFDLLDYLASLEQFDCQPARSYVGASQSTVRERSEAYF